MGYEDDLITEAFDEFTAASTPMLRVAAAGSIRSEGRHRRRVRATTLGVLAALIVITPVAAFAALDRGNHSPPPQPAASPSPSVSPSMSPSPSPSATVEPSYPDGRFTRSQLIGAVVDIPKKGNGFCAGGRVTLRDKGTETGDYIVANSVAHTNLDADPALETAAEVRCVNGDPSILFLLALDRDASGKAVVLGVITGATVDDTKLIRNLTPRPGGGVYVSVCPKCGSAEQTWTDRQYYWDGTKFAHQAQTRPWVADLALAVSDVKGLGVRDGRISVQMTFTVTNRGSVTSDKFAVLLIGIPQEANPVVTPKEWVLRGDRVPATFAAPLEPGKSRSITVTVTRDYNQQFPTSHWFFPEVEQIDAQGSWLRDPNVDNNRVEVKNFL